MIQIDMPMPKCCYECFALDENGDYPFCLISQDQRGYTFNTREKRMPTCPLKAQEPRVMTLEEAPAVDAVPVVHARWEEEPDRTEHWHCSNCGVVWGVSSKAMRYCPGCGAKMMNCKLWDMEG